MEAFHPPTSLKGRSAIILVFHEIMLLVRLTTVLWWSFVKTGVKWMYVALCFFSYVALLSPVFLRVAWDYTKSNMIIRNIRYGERPRNLLDIYLSTPIDKEELQNVVIEGEDGGEDSKQQAKKAPSGRPVVVFVTGGAWIIGYKAWGALLGRTLARCGIIVVAPDYRNFPQGGASDMVVDVSQAMRWVFDNIAFYGGDPDRVYLVAQSAGAHISALAILRQAMKQVVQESSHSFLTRWEKAQEEVEERGEEEDYFGRLKMTSCLMSKRKRNRITRWPSTKLKGFIGISGPYNILGLEEHFQTRGLYKSVLRGIMENDVLEHSPTALLHRMYKRQDGEAEREREKEWGGLGRMSDEKEHDKEEVEMETEIEREREMQKLGKKFPPMVLLHGECDRSCPPSSTKEFAAVLRRMGVPVGEKYYKGKTHTDSILEDPIRGNDVLVKDIVAMIFRREAQDGQSGGGGGGEETREKRGFWFGEDEGLHGFTNEQRMVLTQSKPMIPNFLIDTARFFNPF